MCIVCGSGSEHLLRAIVNRHAAPRRASRLTARAVAPEVQPTLDPGTTEGLTGSADVILRGGPIITMAGTPDAEAIAVRAGRIQAVGTADIVMPHRGRLTRVIDLQGRALLPGFINAHWHLPFTLLCDWVDASSGSNALAEAVAKAAPGEWIVLSGASAELEISAPDNPVIVTDQNSNILAGNSLAAGDEGLPGHVSALLDRFAARLAVSTEPMQARLLRLFAQSAAGGVTCLRVCGIGTLSGAGDLDLLHAAMAEAPRLRLRGTLDCSLLSEWNDLQLRPGFGNDVFRVDTVSAWLSGAAALRDAKHAGWHVTLHASDAAQVDQALACFDDFTARDAGDGIECRSAPPADSQRRAANLGLSLGLTVSEGESYGQVATAAPLSLGLDAAVGASLPLAMLAQAAADGMDMAQALAALTIGAARRCGMDAITGSLQRGKYADFVFLDRDPRSVAAHDVAALRCTATWLNGLDVFRA